MGLLATRFNADLIKIANEVTNSQIDKLEQSHISFSRTQKQAILEGIVDHLSHLKITVALDEKNIYFYYANWIYSLFCHHVKFMGNEQIKDYLINYYNTVLEHIDELFTDYKAEKAREIIRKAIEITKDADALTFSQDYINTGEYVENKKVLLEYLLNKDTYLASTYVKNLVKTIPLEDLYTEIIQKVMQEVGELWHQNKISVAQEHYCTAAMQNVISQFYEILFERPRQKKKVIIACPGSELHDMGARMISDLFTNKGWDSIYLGSAVPIETIIDVLAEEAAVCALSVSMPKSIFACLYAVKQIKEKFPNIIVCVGGRAFDSMENVEEKMGADIYSKSFPELHEKLLEIIK